jgi:simple sugar transport system permease protein
VILYFFFLNTMAGYNIRAVGENRFAAQAYGRDYDSRSPFSPWASRGQSPRWPDHGGIGKYGRFNRWIFPRVWVYRHRGGGSGNNNPFGIDLLLRSVRGDGCGRAEQSYVAGISANMVGDPGLVILICATPRIVSGLVREEGESLENLSYCFLLICCLRPAVCNSHRTCRDRRYDL